jgi:hypothetical protein
MTTELRPGSTVADYRLERLLSVGDMGAVYLATDSALERRVALKVLRPELAADEGFRKRFCSASHLAASLEHPSIVPIHAVGEWHGSLYLAMRYVEGTDLGRVVAAGPIERLRALRLLSQLASALDAAHRRGLVHGHVEASDVLLDHEDNAYLSDFGLTTETVEADVAALGHLLAECLPCEPKLEPVLRKATAGDPDERYSTAGELMAAARQALGVTGGDVARRTFSRRLDRRLLAAGTALLLAVIAGAVFLAMSVGSGNSVKVPPNSVAIIDLRTARSSAISRTSARARVPSPPEPVVSGSETSMTERSCISMRRHATSSARSP